MTEARKNVNGRRRITGEEEMGKTKYIDADKVIDYANQEVSSPFFSIEREGAEDVVTYKNKWAFVKQVMIGMPAADVAPQWIPVTEKLPEKSGEYLVSIGYMLCFSWFYKDDGVWSFINADITAWMPLPSPYKGGEEE